MTTPSDATTDRLRERLAELVERLNARTDEHPEAVVQLKHEVDRLRARLAIEEQEAPCE